MTEKSAQPGEQVTRTAHSVASKASSQLSHRHLAKFAISGWCSAPTPLPSIVDPWQHAKTLESVKCKGQRCVRAPTQVPPHRSTCVQHFAEPLDQKARRVSESILAVDTTSPFQVILPEWLHKLCEALGLGCWCCPPVTKTLRADGCLPQWQDQIWELKASAL